MQIVQALGKPGLAVQWSTVEKNYGRVHTCTSQGLAIDCFVQVPHCRWSQLPVDCVHGPPDHAQTDLMPWEGPARWRVAHEQCSGCFGCVTSLTELDAPSTTGPLATQVKRYAEKLGLKRALEVQEYHLNFYWGGSLVWKIRVDGVGLRGDIMRYQDGKRIVTVGLLVIQRADDILSIGHKGDHPFTPLVSWDIQRDSKQIQELHATLLSKKISTSGLAEIHKAFVFLLGKCQRCQEETIESACRSSFPHPVVCCSRCGCEHCGTLSMRLARSK